MTSLSPVVKLDGSSLPAEWQLALLEVRVEHQFQLPCRVTLRFNDPGYKLVSKSLAKLGTTVEVHQPGGAKLATAEVTAITCDQRPGEQPELGLEALDKSHRLGRKTAIKVFQGQSYSAIVTRLATEAGLSADDDETGEVLDYLMQAESDMALLTEIARRTGFDWWVEGDHLHFKKPATQGSVALVLGEELRSFSARGAGFQPSAVKVDGWDSVRQQLVGASVSADEHSSVPVAESDFAKLVAVPKATSAFGANDIVSAGLGVMSASEAKAVATSVLDRGLSSAVTAKGVAEGDGRIKLGHAVEVTNAGPMSGTYPLTAIEHVYRPRSGFVTRFTSGERRPTTLVDTLAGGGAASAYGGPAHLRSGLTVGVITSNNDDKHPHLGRVRVRYPGVSSDAESGWARVVTVGGGKDRGSVWLPEVDDEVLVGFEAGDARRPVVIGGLFGDSSSMPTIDIKEGAVQSRAMRSRLGHAMSFLDGTEPAKQAIELTLAGEATAVHLGKDKVTVKAPSGSPVEITAGASSIKFSDSGDVSISAPNISLKADAKIALQAAKISIEAESSLEMKSDADTKLSGGILEMQGEEVAKLAGGMVEIN